jgi:hypothetical protein
MHKDLAELPLAEPGREESAKEMFPYKEMTATEYAARNGHLIACFSIGDYRYADPRFNQWIHTLDDILCTRGELERVQELILDTKTLKRVRKEMEEPL